jgi:hypothetical protein
MNGTSRIVFAIASVIALSACSEAEKTFPRDKSVIVSEAPAAKAEPNSLKSTDSDAPTIQADPDSPPPAAITFEIAGICNIESIGDKSGPALDVPVQVESDTAVSGWRAHKAADGTEANAWLRILGQDGGVVFQTPLAGTADRPDVAEALIRESALRSGFRQVKVPRLPQGSYTIEIVFNALPEWVRCRHTRLLQVM